jgi:NADH-quinone oxidoreductase subunit N
VLAAAVLTMTLGNTLAFWQTDLRRLLADSSIAQAGYVLLALAAAMASSRGNAATAWNGIDALWFYVAVYAAATIGAFAMLEHLGREDRSLDGVDELAGLGVTRPLAAAVVAVCMFSLAGVPPLAGFWGKLMIFGSALSVESPDARWWFVGAAVLGVLNAAAAAAYYLRVVAVMYFRTPLVTPRAEGGRGAWAAAVSCAVIVVVVGVYPGAWPRAMGHKTGRLGDRETRRNVIQRVSLSPRLPVSQSCFPSPQSLNKKSRYSSLPRLGVAASTRFRPGFIPAPHTLLPQMFSAPGYLPCPNIAGIIEGASDN